MVLDISERLPLNDRNIARVQMERKKAFLMSDVEPSTIRRNWWADAVKVARYSRLGAVQTTLSLASRWRDCEGEYAFQSGSSRVCGLELALHLRSCCVIQ